MEITQDHVMLIALTSLINQGAIFYVSHSGGKDSQAMYSVIRDNVPDEQIVVVHADLGEVEWEGVQDHIKDTITHPLNVVRANKTLFDMVRHRNKMRSDVPSWPSSAHRQCTSDLKRNPIQKLIRQDIKSRSVHLAVNCMGFRKQESAARSKRKPLTLNKTLSAAGRVVYDFLPIHEMQLGEVWQTIADSGQKPFWAYKQNKRLSCVFCIMGCENDLQHGAEQRPDLYQKYLALEKETGWTMFNGKSLKERVENDTSTGKAA